MEKTPPILYPVLVVFLALSFFFQVQTEFMYEPLASILIFGAIAVIVIFRLLIIKKIFKKVHSWSLAMFMFLFLFLFYRVMITFARHHSGLTEAQLFPVSLIVVGIAAFVVIRWDLGPKFTRLLNIFFGVLLGLSLFNNFMAYNNVRSAASTFFETESEIEINESAQKPDIHFIILDGYLREDQMRAQLNYDNSAFSAGLRGQGFLVSDSTWANYTHTILSVNSVLNMSLMESALEEFPEGSNNRLIFKKLFSENRLMDFLYRNGYRSRVFSSGFEHTSIRSSSDYLDSYERWYSSPSFSQIYNYTFAPEIVNFFFKDYRFEFENKRTRTILEETPKVDLGSEPLFTLSHIMSPHLPITFGKDGGSLEQEGQFRYDALLLTDEYVQRFKNEVEYINGAVLDMVNRIKENQRSSIIVLVSDHGTIVDEVQGAEYYKALMGVVSAVSVPAYCASEVRSQEALVNIFPNILNACLGTSIDYVDPVYRESTYSLPFKFTDVGSYLK